MDRQEFRRANLVARAVNMIYRTDFYLCVEPDP